MPPNWLETAYSRSSLLRVVRRTKLLYDDEAVYDDQ